MRKVLFLLLVGTTLSVNAEVYRWVDEEGVVHYSDKRNARAEPVTVREPSLIQPPAPRATRSDDAQPDGEADGEADAANYRSVVLTSPRPNETYQQGSATINVTAELEPGLMSGHRMRILVDGKPASAATSGTSASVPAPERGTHSIAAEILDGERRVAVSAPVSVHVLSPGIEGPGNRVGGAPRSGSAPTAPAGNAPTGPAFGQ